MVADTRSPSSSGVAKNAFETLGLEPKFGIARSELDAQHRELSRTLHPDRYSGAPAGERRRALNEAINVNQAHRELRDPVKRAELLVGLALQRVGKQAPDGEQATSQMAPEFLMEMMEMREALSEARHAKNLDEARKLAEQVRKRQEELLSQLATALDEGVIRTVVMAPSRDADAAFNSSAAASSSAAMKPSAAVNSSAADADTNAADDAHVATSIDELELVGAVEIAHNLTSQLRYVRRFLEEVDAIEDELD